MARTRAFLDSKPTFKRPDTGLTTLRLLVVISLLLAFIAPFVGASGAVDGEAISLAGSRDVFEGDKGHPKLDSTLSQMQVAYQVKGIKGAREQAERHGVGLQEDLVRVILDTQHGKAAAALVKILGGVAEGWHGNLLQAQVPLGVVEELADSLHVRYVRLPLPTSTEAVGEGVVATGADAWHVQGFDGAGIKIAILDLGFAGYEGLLGSALPAQVTAQSFRADGDITGEAQPHGTACAEIAHQMAPGAELFLANFQTEVEFNQAVDWLIEQGVDVISCSIGWVNAGPYDGTGVVCEAVDRAYANGVLWANAAGNQAYRHWQGQFQDANDNKLHDFSAGVEVNIFQAQAGDPISLFLSWDDSWDAPTQDYDLYLARFAGGVWWPVALSRNWQNGTPGQKPIEAIHITAPTNGTYGALIHRFDATESRHLKLYSFHNNLAVTVPESSLVIPADAHHALAMGAFRWDTGQMESFSSWGPTMDGRLKPDLLGPNYVSSSIYGQNRFGGTSAAAPHAAGAAALLKEANPTWGPDEIVAELRARASENPGLSALGLKANSPPNNQAGYGNLNLADAPVQVTTWEIPLGDP